MNKIYGYARCSTNEDKQDINRQIRELKAAGAEEVIFEYEHGDAKVKQNLNCCWTRPKRETLLSHWKSAAFLDPRNSFAKSWRLSNERSSD